MKTTIKYNPRKTMALLAIPIFFLFGCDDFLEVNQPNSQLTAEAVFENSVTANAALSDIYSQMREAGVICGKLSGTSVLMGCYADELVSFESGPNTTANFYDNAVLSSNASVSEIWGAAYAQIYAANSVYARTGNSLSLTPSEKAIFQGEALFIRALNHLYLTGIFGDIPYITTTEYPVNNTIRKTPAAQVIQKAIADLELATTLLPLEYQTPDHARPNRSTAQALLARAYLYAGQWAEAANAASAVLNETATYALENDLNNVFLRSSTSTIWQLAPAHEGKNTDEAVAFIFTEGPPSIVALSPDFVSQFEPGDQRRTAWIAEITDGSTIWFHPNKYKLQDDTGASEEFSIVLRLEEQYLIRAEARARQGDLIGAREDLDAIRTRAGLPGTTAITTEALLTAILNERRTEFFTEHGHRFLDLKRSGNLDTTLGGKPGWSSTDRLWPLPQSELQVNPNLNPQNPGY
ncbi:RagB/SusD family nutrient uptake outer membrane protein [Flavobacterium sp.]|uniref:RagB/SusD family nutrient uptake outer membrane protein n=1 Tax=Flavobacterium sp. TaxID=239 RepID=UPI0039E319D1